MGAAGAVASISAAVNESGLDEIYIDQQSGSAWSLPLLQGFNGGSYYAMPGPGMFDRLEGSKAESASGFESFVDTLAISSAGLSVRANQSVVDHIYFSEASVEGSVARGFPERFKIDAAHAAAYGISELLA